MQRKVPCDPERERALINDFLRRRGPTKCPPAFAVPSPQGTRGEFDFSDTRRQTPLERVIWLYTVPKLRIALISQCVRIPAPKVSEMLKEAGINIKSQSVKHLYHFRG